MKRWGNHVFYVAVYRAQSMSLRNMPLGIETVESPLDVMIVRVYLGRSLESDRYPRLDQPRTRWQNSAGTVDDECTVGKVFSGNKES